jgi:hypothetical protein
MGERPMKFRGCVSEYILGNKKKPDCTKRRHKILDAKPEVFTCASHKAKPEVFTCASHKVMDSRISQQDSSEGFFSRHVGLFNLRVFLNMNIFSKYEHIQFPCRMSKFSKSIE